MKPEQQRIAIAEACGWKGISFEYLTGYAPWRPTPYSERVMGDLDSIPLDPLPNYLNDLNAMHEAEKLILNYDAGSHGRYIDHLIDVCGKRKDETWHLAIFHATASQRAEAFLRTLNLWTS